MQFTHFSIQTDSDKIIPHCMDPIVQHAYALFSPESLTSLKHFILDGRIRGIPSAGLHVLIKFIILPAAAVCNRHVYLFCCNFAENLKDVGVILHILDMMEKQTISSLGYSAGGRLVFPLLLCFVYLLTD